MQSPFIGIFLHSPIMLKRNRGSWAKKETPDITSDVPYNIIIKVLLGILLQIQTLLDSLNLLLSGVAATLVAVSALERSVLDLAVELDLGFRT